ncbi:MAG TPA: lycopene cyclase domain-containing protein [Puia sp.]|nr:lycopene cyclase domain-containing protein [Puia sp.]
MSKEIYLLLDVSTVLPPLIFSFHPRIRFYRYWRIYLPALVMSAVIFLLWDMYFTRQGVWGFNPKYVTGLYIGNLPVEEWLFFICIPYACIFTAFCRRLSGGRSPGRRTGQLVTIVLILLLLGLAGLNMYRRYTSVTFASLSLLLAYASFVKKYSWLPRFYVSWLLLIIPLLIVDGLLTGTGLQEPVVWYSQHENLGCRILTIPVEDFFYGMELVLLNLVLYHELLRGYLGKLSPPHPAELV